MAKDLRSDGEGSTPPGVSTEIPWSAFRAVMVTTLR